MGAGETVTIRGDLGNPVYAIDTFSYTAGTAGGTDLSGSVSVSPYYYAQSVLLTIVNSGSLAATVRVTITGYLANALDGKTVSQESADSFWTSREGRSRKVSGNRYVQSESQAEFLKAFMADRQEVPPLFAKLGGCPGNPLRVIGDRITVADSELSLSATEFFITSVSWAYDGRSGFRQDFEAVRCSDIHPLASSPGYFIIGTDVLDGTKVVFY